MYNFRVTQNRKISLFGDRIHPCWLKIRPGKAHDLPDLNFMLIGPKYLKTYQKQLKEKQLKEKLQSLKVERKVKDSKENQEEVKQRKEL